jgi:hypothetical protein
MRRWLSCTLVRMCASHLSPHRIVDRQRLTVRAGVCSRRRACVLRRRRRRFRRTRTWRSRSPRCTSAEPPRLASACQSPPPLFGCAAYGDTAHLLAGGAYGGCKDACAPRGFQGFLGSHSARLAPPNLTARGAWATPARSCVACLQAASTRQAAAVERVAESQRTVDAARAEAAHLAAELRDAAVRKAHQQ